MISLQNITDAYGRYLAQKFPETGGLKGTWSTGEEGPRDPRYPRVTAAYLDTVLRSSSAPKVEEPRTVDTLTYANNSDLAQEWEIEHSHEDTRTFTASVTASIEIGQKVSASIGLEGIIDLNKEMSFNLTLSTTMEAQHSVKKTSSWKATVHAQPRAKSVAALMISTNRYDVEWESRVALRGNVAVEFFRPTRLGGSGGEHHIWYLGIDGVISSCRADKVVDTTGYEIVDGGKVIVRAVGKLMGVWGTGTLIRLDTEPLPGARPAARVMSAGAAPASYIVPAT